MHLLAMGGKYPTLFFALFFGGLFFTETFVALRTWALGYWPGSTICLPLTNYLAALVAIVGIGTIALMAYTCSLRLTLSIAPNGMLIFFRWLDVTPTSRIIARVTNDSMLIKLIVVVPLFFFSGVLVGLLGA
ncbi:hypothetical protein B0H16DRAFT_1895626 [Mycena metata]|uniref:Uncharacterized protein n=1 Tax=Mycena metata TaxID=1033252 RepID=A0AAD7MM91_9AGAR|nr:hypothetical protein B0H16DRAFT_1895626 [Mycena metata]